MSVDLEDYYVRSPQKDWDKIESRVVKFTRILLKLFEKFNVTATFFTLGYVAQRHPELIEEVISKGHEISSHSFAHMEVKTMTKKEFEEDLVKSINILTKLTGEKPLGFRAPRFSINKQSFWAFQILKKYMLYDSSIFPVSHVSYGIPESPKRPYRFSSNPLQEDGDGDFYEIPLSTIPIPGFGNFPIAGGFWLRLLPIQLIKYGIKKLNKLETNAVFYIHPHDLYSEKPKLPGYPWHVYWNLSGTEKKLETLLRNFEFASVREVILNR